MRELVRAGIVIQGSSALTIAVLNLAAPRLMGREEYGLAMTLLAPAFLFQGLAEAMLVGAAVAARSASNGKHILARSWGDIGLLGTPTAVFVGGYALAKADRPAQAILAVCFLALALVVTALRAQVVAGLRAKVLAAHYLAALFASVACLPLLMIAQATGYLALMCTAQVAAGAVLFTDSDTRQHILDIWRRVASVNNDLLLWKQYAANLGARGAQIALGPGMLFLASLQMTPTRLAEFRVAQVLLGSLAYAIPVNTQVVQAYGKASEGTFDRSERPGAARRLWWFGALLVLAGVGSTVLWLFYPIAIDWLLRVREFEFRSLMATGPAFISAPLLVAWLLGKGLERQVIALSVAVVTLSWVVGVAWGARVGFAAGWSMFALGAGAQLLQHFWRRAGAT